MKIYKRGETIEFESQCEEESDQLNFLFLMLTQNKVRWDISLRDGKNILILNRVEDK
jgi:hypothetical protein